MSCVKNEMSVSRKNRRGMVTFEDVRGSCTRSIHVLKETIKAREEFKWFVLESNQVTKGRKMRKAGG